MKRRRPTYYAQELLFAPGVIMRGVIDPDMWRTFVRDVWNLVYGLACVVCRLLILVSMPASMFLIAYVMLVNQRQAEGDRYKPIKTAPEVEDSDFDDDPIDD